MTIKIKEVNCETGEEITRDATDAEIAQIEINKAKQITAQAEAEARESARQALLSKLGITQEEAQLLLGGK